MTIIPFMIILAIFGAIMINHLGFIIYRTHKNRNRYPDGSEIFSNGKRFHGDYVGPPPREEKE